MSHKIKLFSIFIFAIFISLYLKAIKERERIAANRIIGKNFIPKIFCMILIKNKDINLKARVIYESWASLCDNYQFVSFVSNANNQSELNYNGINVLNPPGLDQDTYDDLSEKVLYSFKYIYEKHHNYDWYLKVDDDTFIFVNNLRSFLKNKNPTRPVTYGYDFKVYVDFGYHSGGAGYVLSNKALSILGRKLNEDFNFCSNTGSEDIDVAVCLRTLNVYPDKSIDDSGRERFHPFDIISHFEGELPDWLFEYASNPVKIVIYFYFLEYKYRANILYYALTLNLFFLKGPDCCSDTTISFHHMAEDDMKKLSYLLKTNQNGLKLKFEQLKNLYYKSSGKF
jgi:glycoprotein-N-acetylgalactosamine 3-beta-galactosyltransferase